MFSNAANSIFMLRTLTLIGSLISVALVASSHSQHQDFHYDFKHIATFRYVTEVTVISLVYGGLQLPFAAYFALKHKRFIPLHFEFFADQVISVMLATGSGAGIAVSSEFKNGLGGHDGIGSGSSSSDETVDYWLYHNISPSEILPENPLKEPYSKILDKLLAASVFLFLAWICLAIVSIISYNNNSNNTNQTLSTHDHLHHRHQPNVFEPSPTELAHAQHTHVPTDDKDVKESSHVVCV